MKKELFSNVLSLVWNLLLVYVCYTLSRLVFLCVNWDTFSEHFDFWICHEPFRGRYYF